MTDPQQGHAALVQSLDERGLLAPEWRSVWERTPRHQFIPDRIWRQGPRRCEPITTDADRRALISSDEPVVTQVDDGQEDGPGIASSSNSMPSMVAQMLRLLAVRDESRVLEIGTATGYVAALLSARLGDRQVTSVEIDASLSAQASRNLKAAGYAPTLVVADGEHGYPAGAPFDRLISTCALRHVPIELVRQVKPGGILVAPIAREFWSGALVQLTVGESGDLARGPFMGGASYMPMRSHRAADAAPVDASSSRSRWSALDPRDLLNLPFALYAGARLPGVSLVEGEHEGALRVWLQDRHGSAAIADVDSATVFGERDLWAEVQRVYEEFQDLGQLSVGDFSLEVTPAGDQIVLRSSEQAISPAALGKLGPSSTPGLVVHDPAGQ
ncbi:methyltransferase domain-containing protein [Streptomyces sp. NPDC017993]|uniref:methyltransferase domain-containing protein n=1 Tax=Streptomyces sp. NPDC017993 TaxID=3365027 RepID=UPI0037BA3175